MAQAEIVPAAAHVKPRPWGLTLILVALLLHTYAIWSCHYPPLLDLPNHLARHYLEAVWLAGGELPPFYAIEYRVLPNLGADLALPPLLLILEPLTGCKVFLTLILYWLGPALFIGQCGGCKGGALTAALLLLPLGMSSQFFWGFLNYYSGVGLAFLILAHYLWLDRQDAWRPGHLALHTVLVTLLFLWHLAPWAIYGVIAGCHLSATRLVPWVRNRQWRPCLQRVVRFVLATAPGLLLFALYSMDSSAGGSHEVVWGGWVRKLQRPLTLFRGYDARADAAVAFLWLIALIVGFGTGLARGLRWGWLPFSIFVLCALYVILPFRVGPTSDADSRLLPAILVCALAWIGTLPVRRFRVVVLLLAVCLVVRCASVAEAWHGLDRRLQSHARTFAWFAPRSRVLPVILCAKSKTAPELHFLGWAVIDKEIFLPTLFAYREQQPLSFVGPCAVPLETDEAQSAVEEEPTRRCYDLVWVYNPEGRALQVPALFEKLFEAEGVTLWRVR